jgi:hypothetical protein
MRDHRDECREMGRRGRTLAETQFSRDRLGDILVRTLEGVHDTSRKRR